MNDETKAQEQTPNNQDAANYLKITDNSTALAELFADIETKRQGYGEVWATGFKRLDEALDGGFLGEQLIFLGAISSLGKTSFALQLATQIAEQGKDVLIFSLEMSANELNAKTISRYTYTQTAGNGYEKQALQKYRLTTRDILSGRIGEVVFDQPQDDKARVFFNAYDAAKKIAGNVRIVVGENDIDVDRVRDLVKTHIEATGRKPFVVLDYLQILQASEDAKTTEKRLLTDYDVTRLKVISRDFHVPVLVISAFNRNSYLESVNMGSFRESSGIEYSSDLLFGLQYQGMDYQKHWFTTETGKHKLVYENKQDHDQRVRDLLDRMSEDGKAGKPQPIELKILKNRNGARDSLYFHFYPAYNYYEEQSKQTYDPNEDQALNWDNDGGSSVVSKKSLGKL